MTSNVAPLIRALLALRHYFGALLSVIALAACTTLDRQLPVPASATERATVLGGLSNARYFPDTQANAILQEAYSALDRERTSRDGGVTPNSLPDACFLAISGGGDKGAFGAGLLVGWTERGDRPEFKLVTGISTGALIAPFAFLGSNYDDTLRILYTGVGQKDIVEPRWLLTAIFDESLGNTSPLFGLISEYVTDAMLSEIAREYAKGRLLFIGTTDLDAQRPVIWNIGAIAASGRPGAVELVRRILLASAAIPGAFPPVMIDVDVDGVPHQEMHVDGGAIAQTFLYPPTLTTGIDLRSGPLVRVRRAYVIRNARLDPEWALVDRRVFSIAGRAIATMIQYSGQNDLYRLQTTALRDGIDFNLAYIGPDFTMEHTAEFDQPYMRALFEYGREQMRGGTAWHESSPALAPAQAVSH